MAIQAPCAWPIGTTTSTPAASTTASASSSNSAWPSSRGPRPPSAGGRARSAPSRRASPSATLTRRGDGRLPTGAPARRAPAAARRHRGSDPRTRGLPWRPPDHVRWLARLVRTSPRSEQRACRSAGTPWRAVAPLAVVRGRLPRGDRRHIENARCACRRRATTSCRRRRARRRRWRCPAHCAAWSPTALVRRRRA
jgi:hypothetical protein